MNWDDTWLAKTESLRSHPHDYWILMIVVQGHLLYLVVFCWRPSFSLIFLSFLVFLCCLRLSFVFCGFPWFSLSFWFSLVLPGTWGNAGPYKHWKANFSKNSARRALQKLQTVIKQHTEIRTLKQKLANNQIRNSNPHKSFPNIEIRTP